MLPEHINHYNNLHFAMEFTNVAEEAPHYHREMELALMLCGHARYKVHHQSFLVNTGEIFVVDTQDLHYISGSSEDMIMLQLHVDMDHFADTYPNIDVMFFICEETEAETPEWRQRFRNKITFLTHHIAEMMMLYLEGGNDALLREKLNEFVYIMVDQFQAFFIENNEFHQGHDDTSPLDLERLYRIMHYMYGNYEKRISLSDVSELEHLSIHYISHFIRKTSGLSFQNLLNYIRVEQAEKLLNDGRHTLTRISEECGFSSPAYFNKCFQQWHGITPAQYRAVEKPAHRKFHPAFSRNDAVLLLQKYLNTDLPQPEAFTNGYSTTHLVIRAQPLQSAAYDLAKELYPDIVITSATELTETIFHLDDVAKLPFRRMILPASLARDPSCAACIRCCTGKGFHMTVLDDNDMPAPLDAVASDVSEAMSLLLSDPPRSIRLYGGNACLMTSDGLPTPYYTLYAMLHNMWGDIIDWQDRYILAKREDTLMLLIHNHQGASDLNVHLQFDPASMPRSIIQEIAEPDRNVRAALHNLGNPKAIPYSLHHHLWRFASPVTRLLSASDLRNFRLNVSLPRDAAAILTIF